MFNLFRLCRKNRSTCTIRECCFDIVAGVDGALTINTSSSTQTTYYPPQDATQQQRQRERTAVYYTFGVSRSTVGGTLLCIYANAIFRFCLLSASERTQQRQLHWKCKTVNHWTSNDNPSPHLGRLVTTKTTTTTSTSAETDIYPHMPIVLPPAARFIANMFRFHERRAHL